MAMAGEMRCARAAPALEIMRIRTARRGRQTKQTRRSARNRPTKRRNVFLLRSERRRERRGKMRRAHRRELLRIARRRQRDVLCDVMLSARQCETWLTLDELTKLTHYPPASISAQLRHLSKPEYGGFAVEKRPRAVGKVLRWEDFGIVWEYQLSRRVRRISVRVRLRGGGRPRALQHVACRIALAAGPRIAERQPRARV